MGTLNESKEKTKKYGERWIKTRDLIRSITKSSDNYDKTLYENQI